LKVGNVREVVRFRLDGSFELPRSPAFVVGEQFVVLKAILRQVNERSIVGPPEVCTRVQSGYATTEAEDFVQGGES
jgi:hypothetical protein